MFADDTKLYANPLTNYDHLTKDLQALNAWCSEWLLPLNCDKCTVLHLGKNNPMLSYNIAGVPLTVVDYHNDLGIIISSDLKWERHIVSITKKANSMLFLISRSFCNPTPSTAAKLIRMYLRPILEFAAPSWSPYFAKDINTLERVQRRATKLAPAIRHRPYEERLFIMKLPSLYRRRIRGDLILTYRAFRDVPIINFFTLNNDTRLRGHPWKLHKEQYRILSRQHFWSCRVCNHWNALSRNVVESPSVNSFKNHLDSLLSEYFS
ncbi:hypothetical protein Zmor_000918 [Zophobas morio]|uniref:Reverse transcriptase domain-containing protein n=1 Tax=Zophobas morio TaxID=2755281 RepID=A0AA38MRS1_9CUCU|nr:hypothetical protein Zmor_000918 [Zophobas morio]